jgi:uncharacterized membrane protein
MALPGNPLLSAEARITTVIVFGGLAARALWSALVSYRAPPLDLGSTLNARGRIALFTRGERSALIGAAVTIASSGLTVLTFPPGSPITSQRLAIALLLYGLGAVFSGAMFFLARDRRAEAEATARARLMTGGPLKPATERL